MRVRLTIGRSLREYADVIVEAESVSAAEAYVQQLLTGATVNGNAYTDMVNGVSWHSGDETFDEEVLADSAEAYADQDEDADVTVPDGFKPPTPATESSAMDAIHALLDGQEWDADTLDAIAKIVRRSGRVIRETEGQ